VSFPSLTHRLDRAAKRIEELRAWRNAAEQPIGPWSFAAEGIEAELDIGDFWPVVATPVRMRAEGAVPDSWRGRPVELELWLGGEGFVQLSTGLQGGLDPFHHRFPIAEAAAGSETVAIDAEVVPKGMFGSHVAEPRIERAHFVVPERAARALERDLTMTLEAARQLVDHEIAPLLLDAVEAALVCLGPAWPSATDVSVSRLVLGYVDSLGSGIRSIPPSFAEEAPDVHPHSMPIWHLPPAPRPLEPLPSDAVAAIETARTTLAARLARLAQDYPPVGRLALTGHAHLDLAWLWPLAETRRKGRRTFSSVANLMDRYDDFAFNQSSAQLYAWIEADDPALFARVRERVAEGRWEPVGGSWVEPDCQITGGESFVRQLLYGQRYFERTFGRRHDVAWLPDVFGFSGAIPQLLRGAGLTGFFTIKLTWNEIDRFPYDLFEWEGIDGSRVVAHMFRNLPPALGYNGNIAPLDTLHTWRNADGKRFHPDVLFAFGWGDGAGGPSERMLENYARIKEFPALPRLRMARIDEFYDSLPTSGLPRWVGELYLEFHRGTLTSQGKVKTLNRGAEHRLLEAEAFAALSHAAGQRYPASELETDWKTVLLNQFHDILPGSSIAEVYQDTHRLMTAVVERATGIRDGAVRALGGEGAAGWLVANAGLTPRPLTALLPGVAATTMVADATGEPLPAQATEEGLLIHDPARQAPPGLDWLRLAAQAASSKTPEPATTVHAEPLNGGALLQNDRLRVEIGADGTIHRLFDREAGREALVGRANQLWAFVDKPRVYDAWDIESDYEADGEEVGGVERIDIVETGPLRAAVRVVRTWRGSRIEQTYRLLAGSKRLDVATAIDWHERQVLLQARFPLAVRSHEATFETMYGVVRRPTHRNTTWDAARFEVSAHRFADLSEPGYGVALLNDGKYGHGARDNLLSLSLVRGPLYPDPFADEGEHRFTYSLLPHLGDWTEAGVTAEAFALNSPLIVTDADADGPGAFGLIETSGLSLALGSLKRAEEGDALILRLYEPHGARGEAVLRFARPLRHVEAVNLLEEPDPAVGLSRNGDTVRLDVRPFQVLTLRIDLDEGGA
jgi:alpha-mannosidase